MENNLPENLDFLLDKDWVRDFFKKNSETIFGSQKEIEVTQIDRAYAMAPQSYIMLYTLEVDDEKRFIRASSSTLVSRELTLKTMKYVYESGFSEGQILSPEPIKYFPEYNLMLYYNVSGPVLLYELGKNNDELKPKIILAARALKQFHSIAPPEFDLNKPDWNFQLERINRFITNIEPIKSLLNKYNNDLKEGKKIFCHGDYQPNNLIIGDKITVIDFGSVCLAQKELDISSFITQLEIMLLRSENLDLFEDLKKSFVNEYGEFEKKYFQIYSFYHSLLILDSMIAFLENDKDTDKAEVKRSIIYWINKIQAMITESHE